MKWAVQKVGSVDWETDGDNHSQYLGKVAASTIHKKFGTENQEN